MRDADVDRVEDRFEVESSDVSPVALHAAVPPENAVGCETLESETLEDLAERARIGQYALVSSAAALGA